MDLAKSLKTAIFRADIRQKQLADSLGVTQQLVSSWVNGGNMSQRNLISVCDYFNLPVSEFIALGESEVKNEGSS